MQKHTHTHQSSPALSAHAANRPFTAMHDKGMRKFDKDDQQQSKDPLSQHELRHKSTAPVYQLGCCLTDKDLKACNCGFHFTQTSITSKTSLSCCQDLIF